MSNKHVAIVTGDLTHDTIVQPGTTAADILASVGLPNDFTLSAKDDLPFGQNEEVYAKVNDGAKLWASPRASVAGPIWEPEA